VQAGRRGATTPAVRFGPLTRRGLCRGALAAAAVPRLAQARAQADSVLFIGDSMVGGAFGLFLERRLAAAGLSVHREGRPSTGLSRPDFFDWQARAEKLVAKVRPDLCLVMFGGNDAQGIALRRRGPRGRRVFIRWHEPAWTPTYAARVARLADTLQGGGARLGWIGMPVMGRGRLGERMIRINRIVRAEMAIRKDARFLDIWPVLADARGRYAARLPIGPGGRRVRVRAGDDVHLTVAGARYLAAHVEPRVLALAPRAASAAGAP